jgi:nitrite reductase/ring-hydroxylating ferredoxin subunit
VLLDSWVVVGVEGELQRHGEFRTRTIGDISVIVARDGDVVTMFRNLCPHDELPVTSRNEGGRVTQLLCPFHAWAFDLRGRYKVGNGASNRATEAALSGRRDLETFHVSIEAGLVWGRVTPTADAPPSHVVTPDFGRPSPAHRQTVTAPWPTVTEVLRHREDSVWIGPNSAVVHGAEGGRTLVVAAPVGPERTELIAWSELLGDADADTPDALARRRLLGDIVASCDTASNGAPEST